MYIGLPKIRKIFLIHILKCYTSSELRLDSAKEVKVMKFNEFETAKRDFEIFSKKVLAKQNVLSKRHDIMRKDHADFRAKVNKRFNTYSK